MTFTGENLLALDPTQGGIATTLDGCSTKADIEAVFAAMGGSY